MIMEESADRTTCGQTCSARAVSSAAMSMPSTSGTSPHKDGGWRAGAPASTVLAGIVAEPARIRRRWMPAHLGVESPDQPGHATACALGLVSLRPGTNAGCTRYLRREAGRFLWFPLPARFRGDAGRGACRSQGAATLPLTASSPTRRAPRSRAIGPHGPLTDRTPRRDLCG